jgi:hypothetical protein
MQGSPEPDPCQSAVLENWRLMVKPAGHAITLPYHCGIVPPW